METYRFFDGGNLVCELKLSNIKWDKDADYQCWAAMGKEPLNEVEQ